MANNIVHRNAGWKSNTPLNLLLYILQREITILSDKGIAFLTNINYPGIRFTLGHHQFQSLCKNFGGALVLGDDLWASEIQLLLFSLVVRHLCPNSQDGYRKNTKSFLFGINIVRSWGRERTEEVGKC
nr:hypothetical protein Iba_chr07bCG2940 [Ipomoea batatas]